MSRSFMKGTVLLACFALVSELTQAQDSTTRMRRFSIEPLAGYNFSTEKQSIVTGLHGIDMVVSDTSGNIISFHFKAAEVPTLCTGFTYGLRLGFDANKHLAFEMGALYAKGTGREHTESIEYVPSGYKSVYHYSFSATSLRLMPSVKVQFKPTGKIVLHSRSGAVIGLFTKGIFERYSTHDSPTISGVEETYEYTGGNAWGFFAALGSEYQLNERWSITIDGTLIHQNYMPARRSMIKYIVGGIDKLSDLSTYDKEVEYLDEYTDQTASLDAPEKRIKERYLLSNIALQLGIKFRL